MDDTVPEKDQKISMEDLMHDKAQQRFLATQITQANHDSKKRDEVITSQIKLLSAAEEIQGSQIKILGELLKMYGERVDNFYKYLIACGLITLALVGLLLYGL